MRVRQIQAAEWSRFFDGFSRGFRGRPVTVEAVLASGTRRVLARGSPLIGVVAEPAHGEARTVEVLTGTPDGAHLTHVLHAPVRVRVGQVSNGSDEVLILDSATDPTVVVDFRGAEVVAAHGPLDTAVILGVVAAEPAVAG